MNTTALRELGDQRLERLEAPGDLVTRLFTPKAKLIELEEDFHS